MRKVAFLMFLLLTTLSLSADDVIYRLTHLDGFSPNQHQGFEEIRDLSRRFERQHPFEASSVPLDILIPTIEKDLVVLPHTINFARRSLMHPIGNIYLVAPASPKIMAVAKELGCIFVDETTVLPIQI